MDRDGVLYRKSNGVGVVTINRPERRNSLTVPTAIAVYDAVSDASRDPDLRVLVLRGQGVDFCPGADVKGAVSTDNTEVQRKIRDVRPYEVSALLHEMPAVTIAAIRGGCAGAGLGWAAACDFRVASAEARFNTAFLDVGVAGDMGGPWLLSRIIGAGRARDLYFFPRKFGSGEALAWGFVSRVFGEEEFESGLSALVERLRDAAPLALAAMKSNFVEAEQTSLRSYLALEIERHIRLFGTADRQEAFAAFAAKRKAQFTGS
jgi:2-(1,2-epoxy-1,2-dihydrophenyl)acetyl-CoA isomerase